MVIGKDELGVGIKPLHVVSVEDLKPSDLPPRGEINPG